MRIQHNITALNAYRNYSNNTSAVSKNLEKLSSGYKINRAGDDAAGLAVSEKMRAQITGLQAAQKNAKDGISLVQTGEGALTEVHSMLNRMYELANLSANGTYDDPVDRTNYQKEISSLKSEIDRIADSTNFNGIKLLDGSLSSQGATSTTATDVDINLASILKTGGTIQDVAAVKGVYGNTTAIDDIAGAAVDTNKDVKLSYTFEYTDASGASQSKTIELTFKPSGDAAKGGKLVAADGTEYAAAADAAGINSKIEKGKIGDAVLAELNKDNDFKAAFDASVASNKFVLTAKDAGASGAKLTGIKVNKTAADGTVTATADAAVETTKGVDAYQALDMSAMTEFDGTNLDKSVFEINGQKFAFIANGQNTAENLAKLAEAGVSHYVTLGTGVTAPDKNAVAAMAEKIAFATGLKAEQGTYTDATGTPPNSFATNTTGTSIALRTNTTTEKKGSGGLTLQIGDTSEAFNKLTVSIGDMHTKALGIGAIDVSTQEGASAATDLIKAAINSVSSTRGDMGALQNRLEHTINNLSVAEENIQNAESAIRDVDVAKEMMAYTKNNILVQSAQAMLAQANQLPQGVLQLMQ